jgi:hypothetical protein
MLYNNIEILGCNDVKLLGLETCVAPDKSLFKLYSIPEVATDEHPSVTVPDIVAVVDVIELLEPVVTVAGVLIPVPVTETFIDEAPPPK